MADIVVILQTSIKAISMIMNKELAVSKILYLKTTKMFTMNSNTKIIRNMISELF